MKTNPGHWAIVLLIAFIIGLLGLAGVKSYRVAALDSELLGNRFSVGCVERFSGKITLKKSVVGAKLLITLDYATADTEDTASVLPTDGHYALAVRGQPKSDQVWTLRAYYFDKTGQLAETAQQFTSLSCDQQIGADLEL